MTDCYSAYIAHAASAKQKCLTHLARTARDWQKLTEGGSADFEFFQAVKAFVVLEEGVRLGEKDVMRECQTRLESFMVPKFVVFVPSLPKTTTGKIKKTDLS